MKKKMLFICAAGLLTASIASAIESANIVGYQTFKGAASSYKILAPTFSDVLPDNPEEPSILLERITGLNDSDQAQFFDTAGKAVATYFFRSYAGPMGPYLDALSGEGWYTAALSYMGDNTPIGAGTSLFIYTRSAVDYMVSGQVVLDEVEVELAAGFNSVGNSSQAVLDLEEFEFIGLVDSDQAQFFDPTGKASATYFYRTYAGPMGPYLDALSGEGWYTAALAYMGNVVSLKPGDGFFVNTKASNASVIVPAIEL